MFQVIFIILDFFYLDLKGDLINKFTDFKKRKFENFTCSHNLDTY
jgi:hypothetical protein